MWQIARLLLLLFIYVLISSIIFVVLLFTCLLLFHFAYEIQRFLIKSDSTENDKILLGGKRN